MNTAISALTRTAHSIRRAVTRLVTRLTAVEAVVLRPLDGRVLVSIASPSTGRMTARSVCSAQSRRVDCALAGLPLHPAPQASDTLHSPRHPRGCSKIFKSP